MTSAPVVVQVLEGKDAVAKYREVMGATNPEQADAGTMPQALIAASLHRVSRNYPMAERMLGELAAKVPFEWLTTLENESPKRIVIYDLPPLLLSDDVLTFAPHAHGVLLVVTEGTTARGSLERSKELLAEMNLVGVVLNRSSERNDSPYY